MIIGDAPLDAEAYNLAILRAQREGRITKGSFRDRFVTERDAAEWLRARGIVIRRGGDGVAVPDGAGTIRIPQESAGFWSSGGGEGGPLFRIDRPHARGGPSLRVDSALVAFREDRKVYVVAEPADAERWTQCYVFDTDTGYLVHTIERPSPK